ncbi:MAG: sialidase family protein, partial [Paludibacter sp.]|nr:sialidase family protein [Paludibacter sp.]
AVGVSELVRVYKSTDRGAKWNQIAEIEGITWASLFVHNKDIYMLGTSAGHGLGHVVIIKSVDGGYTWTKATDSQNGKLTSDLSYHTAPVPVVFHNGRIWRTMEDEKGSGGWGQNFRAFLMSASLNDDLLKADSWTFSNTLAYDSSRLKGNFKGWLEGNTVLAPHGNIVNILRVVTAKGGGKAALISYNVDGTVGTFDETNGFIDFPGGSTKFHILYDEKTKLYWALSNAVPEKHRSKAYTEGMTRNTLVLMTSSDLVNWSIKKTLLYHPDIARHSFQYTTFLIDGEDIIFVARTAYDDGKGGAYKQHDVNFFTFHRVENFRKL